LFFCRFNSFAAYGAFFVFKKLTFSAPFIVATYHQCFAASLTFNAARESWLCAVRASCRQGSATSGADGVAAFGGLEAYGALISEGTSVPAFWA
jgi:hypothetical protein